MDDNSEMQARDIFVALTMLSGPAPQRDPNIEFIFEEKEPLDPYKGLAGYALLKAQKKYQNMPLGKLCEEALKPEHDGNTHPDYQFPDYG